MSDPMCVSAIVRLHQFVDDIRVATRYGRISDCAGWALDCPSTERAKNSTNWCGYLTSSELVVEQFVIKKRLKFSFAVKRVCRLRGRRCASDMSRLRDQWTTMGCCVVLQMWIATIVDGMVTAFPHGNRKVSCDGAVFITQITWV